MPKKKGIIAGTVANMMTVPRYAAGKITAAWKNLPANLKQGDSLDKYRPMVEDITGFPSGPSKAYLKKKEERRKEKKNGK